MWCWFRRWLSGLRSRIVNLRCKNCGELIRGAALDQTLPLHVADGGRQCAGFKTMADWPDAPQSHITTNRPVDRITGR